MSDDLAMFEPPARKPRQHREATLQAWVDRLIDRIVLPPMFVTGIDHASQTSDNARARMAGRGIRFGVPDVFVSQRHPTVRRTACWLELKRGSPVSAKQQAVHDTMRLAGCFVYVCDTTTDVVAALRDAGFILHPNADNLAAEYEERVKASEKAPRTPRQPGVSKPRVTAATIARAHKAGVWRR